ncbi:hypothetical protein EYM_06265 [Ignicoccus islandicus DSM 13165]|uniref:Uncharacterized protein n=1 Tax=Ignicoccus islandicus DSM 13165 TaxID=940295 RepID=A0A0U3EBH4_9CREN|nr:hypothetical protein [Ignicoccus islandicus]ALU12670.1 hypothetical protein EYM_06265 [Ignicoccus islandicus DSM 13165]
MYGAFFPIGMVAFLLGMANNYTLAINGTIAFLLNNQLGVSTQIPLPGAALCAFPYEGEAVIAYANGPNTSFLMIDNRGVTKDLNFSLKGAVKACASYNGAIILLSEYNNTLSLGVYVLDEGNNTMVEVTELKPVKDATGVVITSKYDAVYGPSGFYVYTNENAVKVFDGNVVKARGYDNLALMVLKDGSVVLFNVETGEKLLQLPLVLTPEYGKAADALLIEANGTNSKVLIAFRGGKVGLRLFKGTAEVLSINVDNACLIERSGDYVAALINDKNLGRGVALFPYAWFEK